MSEIDDESLMRELAEDFGVEEKPTGRSALEQRVLAGFEEIERFVEQHGRLPLHGDGCDIFERLYAVRLDRLRASPECRAVLRDVDAKGILGPASDAAGEAKAEPDDAELLAALSDYAAEDDVTKLVHVRTHEERAAAEEIAQRTPCADFDHFRPVFEKVQRELDSGVRTTSQYVGGNPDINEGDLFIIGGQKVLVAEVIERLERFGPNGRVRVIYDNGTESEMLIRSLQRSMSREADANGRRISPLTPAPLFAEAEEAGDQQSGRVYVLRSKSEHPYVVQNRAILHKIGVTGGDIKARVASAKRDPTYLLADVEVVASYLLANIDRRKLEALLHRVFSGARVDMTLKDRFGFDVAPEEWFLVPLPAIDEAIQRIKDGSIDRFRYDPRSGGFAP
ncbi:MAG TPA: GIY-YIG nuclease family protein [Phycisphaerales bacterium]|nr:GIY-YIG nuclease family protein [Phycisphaerales bacterium]